MIDLRQTIIPKSDQLNADDLIGRTLTIKVTKVLLSAGSEQPVAIHYEGDHGKPYMACKSMRRVLVNVWGPDANAYTGRSMTLYRDDAVKFGGMEVGGIRISHMSHIERPVTMALTATRANRKPFTVQPLTEGGGDQPKRRTLAEWLAELEQEMGRLQTAEEVSDRAAGDDVQRILSDEKTKPHVKDRINGIIKAALDRVQIADEIPAPNDGSGDYGEVPETAEV